MGKSLLLLLAAGLLLAGCHDRNAGGANDVSLIGDAAAMADEPGAVRLVRLDREGQVIPDLAARWAILDDGLDYIFRIDDAAGLPAAGIARQLRQLLHRRSRHADLAALGEVSSAEAVTATVVELRLSSPQPDLLLLLARPDMAVGRVRRASPVPVHIEGSGRAVARFAARRSALVLGGSFADLPVARAANLPPRMLRFDPASGLFGFAVRRAGLSGATRDALSLAIDRDRIARSIGAPHQAKATTIGGSLLEPPLAERRATARALLGATPVAVRVAMPAGPGARLLFALAAQDWAQVGIAAEAVPAGDPHADLLLIDRVTPPDTRAILACALSAGCDPHDRMALINPPFIPIMTPVRWSLVAPALDLFTENALATHPLDQLRSPG